MANPVLSRPDAFTHDRAPQGYDQQQYGYGPQGHQYGQQFGPQGYGQAPHQPQQQAPQASGLMTMDDVITKSAITIGGLVAVAVLTVFAFQSGLIPPALMLPAMVVCGIAAFVVPLVVAVRRTIGAGLALAFSAVEGVLIGLMSMFFEMYYPGIVVQAVLGTFVAAGVTLAAFKFGGVRLSNKVRRIVMISMIGIVIASLLSFALSFAGINLGLYAGVTGPVGGLAWLFAAAGVVLAVLSLVDDFQYIEAGIAQGAPAKESWRAAFGLTVTMVWLYTNILRILSYIRR